jgi:tetratricopeptide (TPR) repeat protein
VGRVATREPVRPLDPNRIAILPFRVTTTDTLLGEGFAELLASEFTGEGAPRAVDMATVLNAWRRAGGGLRTPLPRAKALQVARELGAGLVSEGSIVGLGRQITVTAALVTVPEGKPRGSATRVTASADSLDLAVRRSAANLLAAVGGQHRATDGARFTDSPEAMRAYLIAMSAWRRGRLDTAVVMFDRAIALDSSFAQAAYRRNVADLWGLTGRPATAQRAWDLRHRLSPQDRTVLEGVMGVDHPNRRTLAERLADRERAAAMLPDSPDAQYFAGDLLYHYGNRTDPVARLRRARDYLARSVALDSQAVALRHLVEVGVRLRDTALLKAIAPAYFRTEDIGRWAGTWVAAASSGDTARLAQLRRRAFAEEFFNSLWPVGTALVAQAPVPLLEEMYSRWSAALPQTSRARPVLQFFWGSVLVAQGRPADAERAWSGLPEPQALEAHRARLWLALADAAEGLDVDESISRLARPRPGDSTGSLRDRCLLALLFVRRGDSTHSTGAPFRRADSNCALLIDLQRGPKQVPARLAQLDSANTALRIAADARGFELYLLAQAWADAGDPKQALETIRRNPMGFGAGEAPWTLPYEGRLAAQVGDTAGARRVYDYYLSITASAEPLLAAKRDSIRAEIARLFLGEQDNESASATSP